MSALDCADAPMQAEGEFYTRAPPCGKPTGPTTCRLISAERRSVPAGPLRADMLTAA